MGGSTFYAQKYGKNWCFITNSFAFGSFSSWNIENISSFFLEIKKKKMFSFKTD